MKKKHRNIGIAIREYIKGRRALLKAAIQYPEYLQGNDNIIGRIGEYYAMYIYENEGCQPQKVKSKSQKGYDILVDKNIRVQVKIITAENISGRNVRLRDPWDEFMLIELDEYYYPNRYGRISRSEFKKARRQNSIYSETPIVKKTMLNANGMIGKHGRVNKVPNIFV